MNIITRQVKEKPLTVTVEYPELDQRARNVIKKLHSLEQRISCSREGSVFSVCTAEIYYIEAVGRKTFIYTRDEIYASDRKLYELEQALAETNIVRISKACLMNTDMLYSIKQLMNSQLEATMQNGEKLIVARTYLKEIKRILKEESKC